MTLTTPKLTTFYRYKYGYSFYLFLLSFSLSELAALFDMAAYFRRFDKKDDNNSTTLADDTYFVSYQQQETHIEKQQQQQQLHPDICCNNRQQPADLMTSSTMSVSKLPPQSFIHFVEDVVTINTSDHHCNPHYATVRGSNNDNKQMRGNTDNNKVMHSFATLRKHNQL
jgi:hypothetical protein